MIGIREYLPPDLNRLIEIFNSSVREIARRDYTPEQILAWAPIETDRETLAARNSAKPVWLAEIESVAVGFTDLEPDGHLDRLFVHADWQRLGVASALLTHVEKQARKRSLSKLYSEVSITARPFFERRGFYVIAPQTVTARGQDFLNFRMEKILTDDGCG